MRNCISNQFYNIANNTPTKTAVIWNNHTFSYEWLNKMSSRCAHYLNSVFSDNEVIVPFIMNRTIDMIVLMQGIIKTSRAFLPIDPDCPLSRIVSICEQCSSAKIIIQDSLLKNCRVNESIQLLPFNYQQLDKQEEFPEKILENDLAYIYFTSGTSGVPKGVMITNEAFMNFEKAITSIIPFKSDMTILASTNIIFDISLLEIIIPLLNGSTILLTNDEEQRNARLLGIMIQQHQVDIVQMTPSMINMVLQVSRNVSFLKGVTHLIIGGEFFPRSLFYQLRKLTDAHIYNAYGPTEATIWCTIKEMQENAIDTIGCPLPGTIITIVDHENKPVLPGVCGEICISGKQIARGYVNKTLSADKFIPHPIEEDKIMYKSGDYGIYQTNGEIRFIGRMDEQVKIDGHRIELTEVESVILDHPAVTGVKVLVIEKTVLEKKIFAFYCAEQEIGTNELVSFLQKYILDYMIPVGFKFIPSIPIKKNGKVDKEKLYQLHAADELQQLKQQANSDIQDTTIEKHIYRIIAEHIESRDRAAIHGHALFNELGVNSIALVKILITIERDFELILDDNDFYTYKFNTVDDLILYIKQKKVNTENKNNTCAE